MPWVEALGAAVRELDNVSPGMVTPVTVLHFLSDIACHAAGGKRASITFSREAGTV